MHTHTHSQGTHQHADVLSQTREWIQTRKNIVCTIHSIWLFGWHTTRTLMLFHQSKKCHRKYRAYALKVEEENNDEGKRTEQFVRV